MKKINLNGTWSLAILRGTVCIPKTPAEFSNIEPINAEVPGNFELDLEMAGIIEDPFFGLNAIKMQEYEDAYLLYMRRFTYTPQCGTTPELVFEGIDTIAQIYLNGELIGSAENMLIHHIFPVSEQIQEGENELMVLISPACLAARKNEAHASNFAQKYNYESMKLRKASHMFGWDIMPRLVSAGIFRPVYINHRPEEHIKQAYLVTMNAGHNSAMELFFDIEIGNNPVKDYEITITGKCGSSQFYARETPWFTAGKIRAYVGSAKLWWPKGYGDANLYDVTVTLEKNGQVLDQQQFRHGIRTVKLVRTSVTDPFGNGSFHFEINGKKVFCMGTNWVPVDAYHSRDIKRLPQALELLDDIGCNMVRCWGGNVYEDPYFYNFCDEKGIMVWQDFAMGCGCYPTTPEFCKVMRKEAVAIVRQLRHHPSIVLWAGDNECDQFVMGENFGRDPNRNKLTREVIPNVLYNEDITRPYLPSSPYVDDEAIKYPDSYLTENHLWGPRDYFKSDFYKGSFCHFVSEIGYHGCPSAESMKKFLSPDKLWPWQDNNEWIAHASSPELGTGGVYNYRIELIAKQIKELFGEIPDNLEDFILASQASQAEAKKFFIELFRTGQPHRTGILWWNLLDGWPQFSDAVVDYYFDKKLAYYYIKRSQSPLMLTFKEPGNWRLPFVAVNNAGQTLEFEYEVTDYATSEKIMHGHGKCDADKVVELGSIPYSQGDKKLYVIKWQCGEFSGSNHYIAGQPPFSLEWYKDFVKSIM